MKEHIKITKETIHEYALSDGSIIHIDSGEIIHDIDSVLAWVKLSEEYEELLSEEVKKAKKDMYINNWNRNHRFTKIYQVKGRGLINLSYRAKALLFTLVCLLSKSTNEVLYNNKPPSNKDLIKLSNLKRENITRAFKELEDNNIVFRTSNKRDRHILINPDYAFNGKNLLNNTIDMFVELDQDI